MSDDPRKKDPRDNNTGREFERLVIGMYGGEVGEEPEDAPEDDEDE